MSADFTARLDSARQRMAALGIDVLLLSVGADLPYLTGYEAMPLERLTMLVLPRDDRATLVVPRLEAPRVIERPDTFALQPWEETEDPVGLVAGLAGTAGVVAIGDRTWARFVVELIAAMPGASFRAASSVMGPLRAVKDRHEVEMLRRAANSADLVAAELASGDIELAGRTEAQVAVQIERRMQDLGHRRVNFVIVAAGENAASPHHEPGERIIQPGEVVLCDFGGTVTDDDGIGYCSDITRCIWLGTPLPQATEIYAVLADAHAASTSAVAAGVTCESVDGAAREVIAGAGYSENFVHRTGHGIGIEEHEDPYIVEGNAQPLVAGNAFSIEPGIYLPGRFGFRLEDIVVVTETGPDVLTGTGHDLVVLEA